MRIPKIDLRTPDQRPPTRRGARFLVTFVVLFLTIGAAIFSTQVIFSDHPIFPWGNTTFLGQLRTLVRSADKRLSGERDDRVNILILGMGGEGHDGPFLTDTLILASYQPSSDKIALISIPRDLTVDSAEFGSVKINAVNAYAEQKKRGSGGEAVAQLLAEVLDQPIAYWVRVDFRGFERAINAVGGVDVVVDRAFTDTQFPTADPANPVQTLSFNAGPQHMNGRTALNFSRSRHGGSGEGSDFARSKRQEIILLALREKLFRAGTLLNPFTIEQLIDTVRDALTTNFETWEILRLARGAGGIDARSIALRVMNDANVLETATGPDGAFLLIPRGNDWQVVRDYVHNVWNGEPEMVSREVRVEIQNGTTITGLAQKTAERLTANGFTVVRIKNARAQNYEKSVVYDLTNGAKTEALVKLRGVIDANVALTIPAFLVSKTGAEAIAPPEAAVDGVDFVLVIGKSASL